MPTTATQNNNEVPFPFHQEDDATMLHPRVEAKLNVARRMAELKTHLPFKTTQGQSLLEKLASGTLDDYIAEQPTSQDDDSWLNSGPPIQEHLEPPDWLEVLLEDLRKMPIKEPPEIDAEQLQKVKEGLDKLKEEAEEKLRSSNEHNEHSLLDTGLVECLMTTTLVEEGIETIDDSLIETPTQFMPVVKASTPRLTPIQEKPATQDPVTPLPIITPGFKLEIIQEGGDTIKSNIPEAPATQVKSPPTFKSQEKHSDSIRTKESKHIIASEKPFNEICWIINEHERLCGTHPQYVQVSRDFYHALDADMPKVKGMPFYGYIGHVAKSGQAIGIPVIIAPKLTAAKHSVICVSEEQS